MVCVFVDVQVCWVCGSLRGLGEFFWWCCLRVFVVGWFLVEIPWRMCSCLFVVCPRVSMCTCSCFFAFILLCACLRFVRVRGDFIICLLVGVMSGRGG